MGAEVVVVARGAGVQPITGTAMPVRAGSSSRRAGTLVPAAPRVPPVRLLVLLALLVGLGLMHGVVTGHVPLTTPAHTAGAHLEGHGGERDHDPTGAVLVTVAAATPVAAQAGTVAGVPADPGCEHPGGCPGHGGDGTGHSAAPCIPLLASSLVLLALLVLALTRRGRAGLLLAAVSRPRPRFDLTVPEALLRPSLSSLCVLRV